MKTLSRYTIALLFAAPCLLMADGEADLSTCSTCQPCDEPVTYRGSSNPGVKSAAAARDTNLILGKVGFNVIDSFTGNAWRRVRDLSFPNAVGGLNFERIHVTRATNITTSFGVFGQESGWLHNWQYIIRDYGTSAPTDPYPNQPIIRIGLPDGRDISFTRIDTSSTVWLPAARYPLKLTSNSATSPTSFNLDFSSGLRMEFGKYLFKGV